MEIYPKYWLSRKPKKKINYEKYWGAIKDPSGKQRNRLKERDLFFRDTIELNASIRQLTPGRMLDIGCGPGWLLSLFHNWERHGVELSKKAAKEAAKHGFIRIGKVEEAGYANGIFDLVIMHHVIEHMEDPLSALHKARDILVGGGKLIIATPDFDSACARRFKDKYRMLCDDTHISLFTNESMYRFLRDNGFYVERVHYPYFETRHFTVDNMKSMMPTSEISPPFYGNHMTFYCRKI